jgi:hypothetical protein
MKKKGLTIGKARSALYKTAKVLGDVNSLKRGTVGQRLVSRIVGKFSGRFSAMAIKGLMKFLKR